MAAETEWTMSDEREFMENLTCQRFNFFLVFFSLIIAGAISTEDPLYFKIVLVLGAIMSVLLTLAIMRGQHKLNLILTKLKNEDGHPVKVIDEESCGLSMRNLIGYWFPVGCTAIVALAAVLACTGHLPTPVSN